MKTIWKSLEEQFKKGWIIASYLHAYIANERSNLILCINRR